MHIKKPHTAAFRPLTKAQNTKKQNSIPTKKKIRGVSSSNFLQLLYFFVQNEPLLTVLSTVLASVRIVCTLSQHSASLMTMPRGIWPLGGFLVPMQRAKNGNKDILSFFVLWVYLNKVLW